MIEITPVLLEGQRFLGVQMYLPKCTLHLLLNMNLMILDSYFDLAVLEKKCPVPMIQCSFIRFDMILSQNISKVSDKAHECGIVSGMNVKEAITCVFLQKETS